MYAFAREFHARTITTSIGAVNLNRRRPLDAASNAGVPALCEAYMVTSTFAHPYMTQVVALALSGVPVLAMAGLMLGAALRGDRGRARIRVPVPSR